MIKRFQMTEGSLAPAESDESPVQVFIDPDKAERNILRTAFQMDDHTLSSALDPDEVSRIEIDQDRTFLIWKRPTNYSSEDSFFFDVASIGLLLSKERLVVILTEEIALASAGSRLVPPLRSPLDVMMGILFNTIQHYLEHLKVIKMIAREVQRKINTSMENKHLIQMFNLSESLVYYINAINSNGGVLARLRNHAEREHLPPAILAFIDDLIIENNQCYKQAEIYSTVFSGLMDARGNLVNNNMNMLLRNLTIINIVFLPLNLIASIGGMSEYSVWMKGIDWRLSYALFCVTMVALGWVTSILLKRVYLAGGTARAPERGAVRRREGRERATH